MQDATSAASVSSFENTRSPSAAVRLPSVLLLATFFLAFQPVLLNCAQAFGEENVVHLIPADAGICLQVHNLEEHVDTFTRSAIYRRITRYPPVRQWADENRSELEKKSLEFERHLGFGPQHALRTLLGHSAALAVWPPSAPEADDGPALVVVKAEDSAVLRRLVDALCDAQRRWGNLRKNETISASTQKFTVRVIEPEAGQPPILISLLGDHGVMTNNRQILRQVIDLYTGDGNGVISLAGLPEYHAALARINPRAAATLFVNPRPWDGLIAQGQQQAEHEGGTVENALPAAWSQVRYFVGSVDLGSRLSAEAFLEFQPRGPADRIAEVAASFSGVTEFAGRIPSGALIALAGRVDVGRLTRWMLSAGDQTDPHRQSAEELSRAARGVLTGVDLFDDIMAGLGPDVGAYLAAAPEKGPGTLPLDLVVGIDTQPRWTGDMAPDVTDVLDHSLRTVLGVLVLVYNADKGETVARLETTLVDGLRMTSVTGVRELGKEGGLAYAFDDGMLLAGSSRRAVQEAIAIEPADSLAESRRLADLSNPRIKHPSHVLFVDFSGLRNLIAGHPGVLRGIQEHNNLNAREARRNLTELVSLLSLADTLALEVEVAPTGIGVSAALAADSQQ